MSLQTQVIRDVKLGEKLSIKEILWWLFGHVKTPLMMQIIILKSTNL